MTRIKGRFIIQLDTRLGTYGCAILLLYVIAKGFFSLLSFLPGFLSYLVSLTGMSLPLLSFTGISLLPCLSYRDFSLTSLFYRDFSLTFSLLPGFLSHLYEPYFSYLSNHVRKWSCWLLQGGPCGISMTAKARGQRLLSRELRV